ncbi:MAG: hypothetical protein LBC18_01200 [Opitutaceae bacterium]|nr:hypothetical protein [Opitutaceae bacterium]
MFQAAAVRVIVRHWPGSFDLMASASTVIPRPAASSISWVIFKMSPVCAPSILPVNSVAVETSYSAAIPAPAVIVDMTMDAKSPRVARPRGKDMRAERRRWCSDCLVWVLFFVFISNKVEDCCCIANKPWVIRIFR